MCILGGENTSEIEEIVNINGKIYKLVAFYSFLFMPQWGKHNGSRIRKHDIESKKTKNI